MKEQILIDALERIKEMTNFPERISADNGMLRLSAINLIIEAALSQFHSTGKEKGLKWVNELIDIRNKLYNSLPTGEISAYDLIQMIKWHINDIDVFCSLISKRPATASFHEQDDTMWCSHCNQPIGSIEGGDMEKKLAELTKEVADLNRRIENYENDNDFTDSDFD